MLSVVMLLPLLAALKFLNAEGPVTTPEKSGVSIPWNHGKGDDEIALDGSQNVPSYNTKPYSFGFRINDDEGNHQAREEKVDVTGATVGSYSFVDASGIYRRVEYVADANGFRAVVTTNEPGTVSISPAHVLMRSGDSLHSVSPATDKGAKYHRPPLHSKTSTLEGPQLHKEVISATDPNQEPVRDYFRGFKTSSIPSKATRETGSYGFSSLYRFPNQQGKDLNFGAIRNRDPDEAVYPPQAVNPHDRNRYYLNKDTHLQDTATTFGQTFGNTSDNGLHISVGQFGSSKEYIDFPGGKPETPYLPLKPGIISNPQPIKPLRNVRISAKPRSSKFRRRQRDPSLKIHIPHGVDNPDSLPLYRDK